MEPTSPSQTDLQDFFTSLLSETAPDTRKGLSLLQIQAFFFYKAITEAHTKGIQCPEIESKLRIIQGRITLLKNEGLTSDDSRLRAPLALAARQLGLTLTPPAAAAAAAPFVSSASTPAAAAAAATSVNLAAAPAPSADTASPSILLEAQKAADAQLSTEDDLTL